MLQQFPDVFDVFWESGVVPDYGQQSRRRHQDGLELLVLIMTALEFLYKSLYFCKYLQQFAHNRVSKLLHFKEVVVWNNPFDMQGESILDLGAEVHQEIRVDQQLRFISRLHLLKGSNETIKQEQILDLRVVRSHYQEPDHFLEDPKVLLERLIFALSERSNRHLQQVIRLWYQVERKGHLVSE